MSDAGDSSGDDNVDTGAAPTIDQLYPVGEAVEVPSTKKQLFKTVLVEGTPGTKPPKGAQVSVHYVGTLESDGSKFDSSRDRNELFNFQLGKGSVIKGWDEGVATMNKGEKAILRCLPEYAYGANGSPPKIPANSTLNFEVELFDWTKSEDISEAKDKSIMKNTTTEGKDWEKPDYESVVTADVTLRNAATDAVLWEKQSFTATIGETDLPPGLEALLKSMKKGEECTADIAASAVGGGHAAFGVPAKTAIKYQVKLTEFNKVKTWEFKGQEKVNQGVRRKDEGNAFFKAGDYTRAEKKYKRALEFIEYDYGLSDDEKVEAKKAKIAVFTNLAAVQLKTGNLKDVIANCNKCLEADEANVKALFRRGKAHALQDDWDEGRKDLRRVIELDPNNADAVAELAAIDTKVRELNRKEKALYGNLFEKMSRMEEREKKSDPTATTAATATGTTTAAAGTNSEKDSE